MQNARRITLYKTDAECVQKTDFMYANFKKIVKKSIYKSSNIW